MQISACTPLRSHASFILRGKCSALAVGEKLFAHTSLHQPPETPSARTSNLSSEFGDDEQSASLLGGHNEEDTIDLLLGSPALSAAFELHLKSECSSENFNFLRAAQQWKQDWSSMTIAARRARASYIYTHFVDPDMAQATINLSSKLYDQLRQDCGAHLEFGNSIPVTVWDDAALEIKHMLARDNLPRFKKSQLLSTNPLDSP
jgi:hypothetical protein